MCRQTTLFYFKLFIINGLFWLSPLTFAVAPEIEVVDDEGSIIVEGVTTVDFRTATEKTFTVKNTGDGDLVLTSAVEFSHGGDGFMVNSFATPTTVTPHTSITFRVTLEATTEDTYTGTLAFDNNDSNESPFSFAVNATIGFYSECDDNHLNGCTTEVDCAKVGGVYAFGRCHTVNALIHPEKGRSVALDAKAHQVWDEPTRFAGGTSVEGSLFLNGVEVVENQITTWAGHIKVAPLHVGRQADLLFAIGIEPSSSEDSLLGYSGDYDTMYYAFDGTLNRFFPVDLYAVSKDWPTELAKLTAAPFKENVTLPDNISLDLWTGKLNELTEEKQARFYTFFGYVLSDGIGNGTIIFNGMPIITTLK